MYAKVAFFFCKIETAGTNTTAFVKWSFDIQFDLFDKKCK